MKLYIYTGEALNSIVPNERRDTNKLLDMHIEEMPRNKTRRVSYLENGMCPKHQIMVTELVLAEEKKNRNIQLFTHSPYIIEAATLYGKKFGYEIKYFHVIYNRDNGITTPVYKDNDGSDEEAMWVPVCEAVGLLDDLNEEINTKANPMK